jgi:hypothetical protein
MMRESTGEYDSSAAAPSPRSNRGTDSTRLRSFESSSLTVRRMAWQHHSHSRDDVSAQHTVSTALDATSHLEVLQHLGTILRPRLRYAIHLQRAAQRSTVSRSNTESER